MSSEKPLVEAVRCLPRLKYEWDSEGIWASLGVLERAVFYEYGPVLTRFQAISDDQLVVLEPGLEYITGWCQSTDRDLAIETWVLGVVR